MDEGEFLRMLERYPVVRTKTHCRVQWNDMWDQPTTKPASSGIFIPAGQDRVIDPADTMEDALDKFLAPYFSSNETTKIQQQLEKTLNKFMSTLNLEDVNDLCVQFLDSK